MKITPRFSAQTQMGQRVTLLLFSALPLSVFPFV